MLAKSFAVLIVFSSVQAWSHARLVNPVPRNNNSGIKSGPCGGVPRTATPTVLNPGQQLQISITETIDHPGRFYVDFSAANDLNFVRLLEIPDDQNTPPVPHTFTGNITVPNTLCNACTLRIIQSMEENPNAPSLYYSCADIVISSTATPSPTAPPVGPTPTPVPGGGGGPGQSGGSAPAPSSPKMGGCGTVDSSTPHSGGGAWFLLGLPLIGLAALRRRYSRARA